MAARRRSGRGAEVCRPRGSSSRQPVDGCRFPHDGAGREGADRRARHVGVRQSAGDGGGRAGRIEGAADRGVRPRLALRQPPAHDALDTGRPGTGGSGGPSLPRFVARVTAVPAPATTFSLTPAHTEGQEVYLSGRLRVTGAVTTNWWRSKARWRSAPGRRGRAWPSHGRGDRSAGHAPPDGLSGPGRRGCRFVTRLSLPAHMDAVDARFAGGCRATAHRLRPVAPCGGGRAGLPQGGGW